MKKLSLRQCPRLKSLPRYLGIYDDCKQQKRKKKMTAEASAPVCQLVATALIWTAVKSFALMAALLSVDADGRRFLEIQIQTKISHLPMKYHPVFLQLRVAGQAGAHGRLVINPAEQVFRSVLGAARNRRPDMAGKRATEVRGKVADATRTRALVRTTSR